MTELRRATEAFRRALPALQLSVPQGAACVAALGAGALAWLQQPTPPPAVAEPSDPDRLRTGLVRYLGYANEVGEAFRPLVPRAAVNASYGVASAYVLADAAWRSTTLPAGTARTPLIEVTDTLVWQGLASVIIPGFAINRVVWAAARLTAAGSRVPTAAGLACIPLIVHPIDQGVGWVLDQALRPSYPDCRPDRLLKPRT